MEQSVCVTDDVRHINLIARLCVHYENLKLLTVSHVPGHIEHSYWSKQWAHVP